MPQLNANIARYFFETAALPPEVFQVARFRGVEEISRLYRYELELVSTDPQVDFAGIVNQTATLIMMRGLEVVPVRGVVIDFRQEGRSKDFVSYRVVLAPRLWRLSLTYQSRIFQHLSVEDILTQVLQESGLTAADFDIQLSGAFKPTDPLEYVVQYRETDLDFICRLMEKYGIFFFFEHSLEREKLIITDDRQNVSAISGQSELDYHEQEGLVSPDVEVVRDLVCREQIVTGKVMLKDYNYETPDVDLMVESQLNAEMPGVYYEYGDHYKDPDEGAYLARVRNEEIESRRRVFEGSSNCVGLRCGFSYTLNKHYRGDFNGDYLILRVLHQGSQRHALGLDALPGEDSEADVTYGNAFLCRPLDQPFRPERRTPIPQIPGVMVAHTEHPDRNPEDYGHLDEDGRYRAKMNFDIVDTPPANGTKPLRMNQPYSGPDYGIHFPNHDSTEMIWACVNGDVDRPMALGTVPNPNQASPSTLANKWQSVIRTWGKNELTFDDKQGEENIYMHATKDHTVRVRNNQSISVGGHRRVSVQGNETVNVHGNQIVTIDGEPPGETGGGFMGNAISVTGDYTLETTNTVHIKCPTSLTLECPGSMIKLEPGKITLSAGGGAKIVLDANALMQAAAGAKVFLDANAQTKASGGGEVFLDGNAWMLSASGAEVFLDANALMQAGGGSVLITPSSVESAAPTIKSSAAGPNEITGTPVKLN